MAVTAQQLNIILTARDREFTRAMDRNARRVERFSRRSQKSLSKTTRSFAGLGVAMRRLLPALSAAVLIAAAKRAISALDEIGKTADKLGLTTDALQELRTAADSSGIAVATFDMAMQRFGRRLAEARQGTGEAVKALKEMGVELFDANGVARSLEDVFDDVADSMKGMSNQTDKNRLAMKLFDSEGVKLVNLLRHGADGMAKMRQEARDLGTVIDEKLVRKAEDAQTELGLMGKVISKELSTALVSLTPAILFAARSTVEFIKAITGIVTAIQEFVDPMTDLEVATDNIVTAMGDEIRQSQLLEIALGSSTTATLESAKANLKDALARQQNVTAMIAQARTLAVSSKRYVELTESITLAGDHLRTLGDTRTGRPRSGVAQSTFDEAAQRLVSFRIAQGQLLIMDTKLADQQKLTAQNIGVLENAIANATDGMVAYEGAIVEATESTPRLGLAARAAAKGISAAELAVIELEAELEKLGLTIEDVESVAASIESSMADAFMGMVDGTKSAKDAFRSMARDIISELYRVLVVQQLVGDFKSGGGGILGSVFGAVFPGKAHGGAVQAGQPVTVGEHGREIFVPAQGGRILSVAQSKGAGGGESVNQTFVFNISANGDESVLKILQSQVPAITRAAEAGVLNLVRRGGAYRAAFR